MFDKGTIQIAKVAGIPIRLHWSFLLIFLWVGYNAWLEQLPWKGFLFLQFYVLILFLCVVMHEYGHALTARKFGNKTRDILLTPIGGIARLESISEKPMQELLIAIAGPAVNFGIVILIGIYLFTFGGYSVFNIGMFFSPEFWKYNNDFLPLILKSNLILGLFNFIPAFPMDGGRILRALLSFKWPRLKSTLLAARLGQICAIGFLFYAVSEGHWMLCLVGFFIFVTAGTELKQVKWESILGTYTAQELMDRNIHQIQVYETMQAPIDLASKGIENNYLAFEEDRLAGVLPYNRIVYCLKNNLGNEPVYKIMNTSWNKANVNESIKTIFHQMQTSGLNLIPVFKDEVIVGVLEETQIKRFVELKLNSEI